MKPNFLIVDDSPVMRRFIQRVLDATDLDMGKRLEAGNGWEGLELLKNEQVDIVLADMNMPVMDGAAMVRAMRRHPDWKKLPVLVVSTDRSAERMDEMRALGVDGYVTKPFSPEQLEAKILAAVAVAEQRTAAAPPQADPADHADHAAHATRGSMAGGAGTEQRFSGLASHMSVPLVNHAVAEILETMCFLEVEPAKSTEANAEESAGWPAGEPPPELGAELFFAGCFCGTLRLFADQEAAIVLAANFWVKKKTSCSRSKCSR